MKKWIEPIKTCSLVLLVSLSFVLTGFLWYSAPSYKEQDENGYLPAPNIGALKYNQKSVDELSAPPLFIAHQLGKHTWVTGKQKKVYTALRNTAHNLSLDQFTQITPTAKDWKRLFHQSAGFELKFFRDLAVEQLDSFFNQNLMDQPLLTKLDKISRVWIFAHPKSRKVHIWFISDRTGAVVQATATGLTFSHLSQQIAVVYNKQNLILLEAVAVNGRPPWQQKGKNSPFTRILYLPTKPVQLERYVYSLETISIENMKQWLFKGASIEPIKLNKNVSVFMDNEQILTYYQKKSYMEYTDTSDIGKPEEATVSKEINLINTQFMSKHRGWTGNFLLEQYKEDENGNEDQYSFRLLKQGLPVYWGTQYDETPHPDQIQLQAKPSNVSGVGKYIRSLIYLSDEPTQKKDSLLPDKAALLKKLAKQNIALSTVERILPCYQAKSQKNNAIRLVPVWIVVTQNGKQHMIGVGS